MRDDKTVVVDAHPLAVGEGGNDGFPDDSSDEHEPLTFHDPNEYPSNPVDSVEELTVAEAREEGAVACSKCFNDDDTILYNFPYLQRGVA